MTLKEQAGYYYNNGRSCAEALLSAANDVLGTDFSDAEILTFTGFGGGMGCKSTCGSLTGAIAILSRLYGKRSDIRAICSEYVTIFTEGMGIGTIECGALEDKYRTVETRCTATVEMTADMLEKYIDRLEGRETKKAPEGEGCTISPDDIKRVKGMGFLNHKGTNRFNARIITRNGKVTAEEFANISEAAAKYGDGDINLTTRLTIEVSGVEYDDIDAFRQHIAKAGLVTGGTGNKVRPVVACKGTTCQYGNYDTAALSLAAHKRFYEGYRQVILPHKFKIAFGGCPNNCVKPNLNDIGIFGVNIPQYDPEKCRGCKKCQVESACPVKAAKVIDGKMVMDPAECNNCGRCIAKCPFHAADEGRKAWGIYIGGRWGKRIAIGKQLTKYFYSEAEVLDEIEKAILLFRSEGLTGERFADTIERIGFERANELMLSNELLERKAEILGLNVVGGGTC